MRIALPFESATLRNGLRVFAHEDPRASLVGVNVWYHVGSANERPGRTGFAHLFEHLMFEGSANVPAGRFDRLLEEAGASNNGSTSQDRTNYWITAPAHAFELALYLESDRMGWLLPAITQENLDTQRSVVMNERRQSYENRPYGLAWETLLAALYPPDHPYHWPTIGSMDDLRAATLEEVVAFFATHYAPGNATLAVAGPLAPARALETVARYFEEVPAGAAARAPVIAPPVLEADRRPVLEDDVHLHRVYLAWHSPPAYAEGDAELDLAAQILAHGKTGRLYRSLVYRLESAQDVRAFQHSGRLCSTFIVVVTARPGQDPRALEHEVRSELERMAGDGVLESELERARNLVLADFVDELQSLGGFGGRADRLNHYAFHLGHADYLNADLDRYRGASTEAVSAAVREHLVRPCVALDVVPSRSGVE